MIEVSELGLNITDGDVQPPKPKRYSSSYIWAALSFWMNQTVDKPELNLWYERRCTLQLPSLRSCYSANPRHQLKEPYLPLHRKTLLDCFSFEFTEIQKDKWFQYESNNNLQLFGSPFLDHMLNQGDLAECLDGLTSWEPQFDDTRLAYQLLSPVRKR